jgi:uncharacterized protein
MAAGHREGDPNTQAPGKGNCKMQSELDVTRGMYSAFSRGDVASVLAALAPQIVWIEAEGFPSAGTYTTPDAVLHKVFMRLAAEWEAFTAAPHQYVCQDQTVVAIGEYSGTWKATGKAIQGALHSRLEAGRGCRGRLPPVHGYRRGTAGHAMSQGQVETSSV